MFLNSKIRIFISIALKRSVHISSRSSVVMTKRPLRTEERFSSWIYRRLSEQQFTRNREQPLNVLSFSVHIVTRTPYLFAAVRNDRETRFARVISKFSHNKHTVRARAPVGRKKMLFIPPGATYRPQNRRDHLVPSHRVIDKARWALAHLQCICFNWLRIVVH